MNLNSLEMNGYSIFRRPLATDLTRSWPNWPGTRRVFWPAPNLPRETFPQKQMFLTPPRPSAKTPHPRREMFNRFDVGVIGGGHAGCEAAAGAARMGAKPPLVPPQFASMGAMSCNPAIGG